MTITKSNENGKITLSLDGWLDTAAAPTLGAEVEAIEAADEIILDFDKVEYMSSSGLRQVVAAHRKAKELGAKLTVCRVHNEIMSIFALTGLDKKLTVTEA